MSSPLETCTEHANRQQCEKLGFLLSLSTLLAVAWLIHSKCRRTPEAPYEAAIAGLLSVCPACCEASNHPATIVFLKYILRRVFVRGSLICHSSLMIVPHHLLLLGLLCLLVLMADTAMGLAPKILVLGGTGFIGSAVSRIAMDSGCQVHHDINFDFFFHTLEP